MNSNLKPRSNDITTASAVERSYTTVANILEQLGAQYQIKTKDGKTFTNMAPVKHVRRPKVNDFSVLNIGSYLDGAAPGALVRIPYKKFSANAAQGAVVNRCLERYGAGNYTTSINRAGQTIDVVCGVPKTLLDIEKALAAEEAALPGYEPKKHLSDSPRKRIQIVMPKSSGQRPLPNFPWVQQQQ